MTSDGRQAMLPENREETKVGDMGVGEAAYIVKWGMWVDSERRCWLHPDYTVRALPAGTMNMRIERREDGYHVWTPPGASWRPVESPSYLSPVETTYIPVTQLHDVHQSG